MLLTRIKPNGTVQTEVNEKYVVWYEQCIDEGLNKRGAKSTLQVTSGEILHVAETFEDISAKMEADRMLLAPRFSDDDVRFFIDSFQKTKPEPKTEPEPPASGKPQPETTGNQHPQHQRR